MIEKSITYQEINKNSSEKLNIENFLWRIRNDPLSRKYSINTSYIPYQNHKKWFIERLNSNKSIIYVCKIEDVKIGIVRFENIEINIFEVSVILSPDYRKHRISQKLLFGAINEFYKKNKEVKLLAKIHKDNISSLKIFKKLGFTITENDKLIKDFDSYVLEFNKLVNSKALPADNTNNSQKTVGIMQPTFLPWLGYFALMEQVDYFVLLDDVQLSKQSWQVRNRIKMNNDNKLWLSLPIKKNRLHTNINEVEISDDQRLINKILNSFKHHYSKNEYFLEAFDLLEKNINYKYLSDITSEIILDTKFCTGINTAVYKSSELNFNSSSREQRLVDIINYFDCKNYVSPIGSSNYLELEKSRVLFNKNKIKIKYLNFEHPVYKQHGKKFVDQLGIVDCISSVGYQNTLNIIRSGTRVPTDKPRL